MLHRDNNHFLGLGSRRDDTKIWTITAGGQIRNEMDHDVLVWHKKQIKTIAWKDLGNTMQLIRLVPDTIAHINDVTEISDGFVATLVSVLTRYQGYDENSDQGYYYLPKISGRRLDTIIQSIHEFCNNDRIITVTNEEYGRYTLAADSMQNPQPELYILAEWCALALIYGKATLRDGELRSYRIQIPYFQYDVIEKLSQIIDKLRAQFFVISSTHDTQAELFQRDTNDPTLLAYLLILLGDASVSIGNNVLEVKEQIAMLYDIPESLKGLRWKLYTVKR